VSRELYPLLSWLLKSENAMSIKSDEDYVCYEGHSDLGKQETELKTAELWPNFDA
jgi:hypothetical protein